MQNLLEKFSDVRVLVVGDIMLDQYWWGSVERISPEAPVPIVHLNNKSSLVGGAANVAANIKGLGAEVFLVGVVGTDPEGIQFRKILNKIDISDKNVLSIDRSTTIKTRIVAHNQQIVRIDQEDTEDLDQIVEELIWQQIEKVIDKIDIVLISDYAKGVITENLASRLITLVKSKKKFVIVDPKGKNYEKYRYATIITPNNKEAVEATNSEIKDEVTLEEVGSKLLSELDLDALIITRGEKGMALFQKGKTFRNLESTTRNVFDVTGAGDTVIATLTVAIGAGSDFYNAAKLANTAAGLVVQRVGTTAIKLEDLRNEFL